MNEEPQRNLSRNGWPGRSKTIVIDPELETWVWNGSDESARALGWNAGYQGLKEWLGEKGHFPSTAPELPDPKKAVREVLKETRKRRANAGLFGELARSVSLDRCQCSAFWELRYTLQRWFPRESI